MESGFTFAGFFRGRLYARLMGAALASVFLLSGAVPAVAGWIAARDPETGRIRFEADFAGSWFWVGGVLVFLYAAIAFAVAVAALGRCRTRPDDDRVFTVALWLILPFFPVGTIFSLIQLSRLAAAGESNGGGAG